MTDLRNMRTSGIAHGEIRVASLQRKNVSAECRRHRPPRIPEFHSGLPGTQKRGAASVARPRRAAIPIWHSPRPFDLIGVLHKPPLIIAQCSAPNALH